MTADARRRAAEPATTRPSRTRHGPLRPLTAAGSCPRRWSPRSTSWTPRTGQGHGRPGVPGRARPPAARLHRRPEPAHRGADGFAEHAGGARILLKREDLNHTGSHKINNVLGQALLTKRMGKTRVIAETGAGQHGVATRHRRRAARPRVRRLHGRGGHPPAGAQRRPDAAARRRGHPGHPAARTLKDAINEAHARLGHQRRAPPTTCSARSPGRTRSRRWCATSTASSASRPAARCSTWSAGCPTRSCACVGGGSNAIGHLPRASSTTPSVRAVRLRGRRRRRRDRPARRHDSAAASPGVLHGARTYVLQDEDGQTHRVALDLGRPGLPGRRPRARLAHDTGRAELPPGHRRRGDGRVRAAVPHRGDHPGDRERARARRRAASSAASSARTRSILVNLSGRGDKDVDTAAVVRAAVGRGPRRGGEIKAAEPVDEAEGVAGEHPDRRVRPHRQHPARRCGRHDGVAATLAKARGEDRAALVGYLPAGFPDRRRARSRPWWPWSRPASTSSRSACRTPTR